MAEQKFRDLVAPFVFGYYTPFWIGDRQSPVTPSLEDVINFGGIIGQYEIGLGIVAATLENGLLLFDFSRCPQTPIIVHRESLYNSVTPVNGTYTSEIVSRRLGRTESKQRLNQAFYRTVLLSHALLLENAGHLVGRMAFSLPRIENLRDTVACHELGSVWSEKALPKSTLHLPKVTLDRSFTDLAIAIDKRENLLRALELHKLSHYRFHDHRFAECLVLSWTVCENIVDFIWRKMIEEVKSENNGRMTKRRVDVLCNSAVYTASVRIETLELAGFLSIKQADDLNTVRRARNNWLHSLGEVDEQSALHSIRLCAGLISSIFGLDLSEIIVGGAGGEGGGMFLDVFMSRFPSRDLSSAYDG